MFSKKITKFNTKQERINSFSKNKNKNVYFSYPIVLYDSSLERRCIELIKNNISFENIVNPKTFINELKKCDNEQIGGNMELTYNNKIFFPNIDKCSIFVYYIDSTNKITKGVSKELQYALMKYKEIYKIVNFNDSLQFYKMDKKSINNRIIKDYSKKRNWSLKNISDYKKFYDINHELKDFMLSQFNVQKINNNQYIQQAVVSHKNSVYITNDFKNVVYDTCLEHQLKHSYINPLYSEKLLTCPFTNLTRKKPDYSKFKLDNIRQVNFDELLLNSRTLHKSMFIFNNDSFITGKGLVFRSNGDIILVGGKPKVDTNNILGVEILFDLDIIDYYKSQGMTFFNMKIFNQYLKAIEIIQNFIEEFWCVEYKMGFSGNGIYIILPSFLFKEHNFTFDSFSTYFADKRNEINKRFIENKIDKIVLEKKYGWNRYFKVLGTFHLKHERLSIPLNFNESLDYDWMKEMTNIDVGLESNISKEILRKSNW